MNVDIIDLSPRGFLQYLEARYPVSGSTDGILICVWLKNNRGKGIRGQAKDKNDKPVLNASVEVKGKPQKTHTDQYGYFMLDSAALADVLIISNPGKETEKIRVNTSFMKVTLSDYVKIFDTLFQNGLQEINLTNATGVYTRPNDDRFQYSFTNPNVIDRVLNVSVPFPKNNNTAQGIMPGEMSVFPGETRTIPYRNSRADSINNFFGYYASAYFTWRKRYTLSGNYRADYANRFSSAINKKGIGLWSVGAAWHLNEEEWMKTNRIELLKLRTSFGVNGNMDYNATPLRVIQPTTPGAVSSVAIPATPMLGWEKLYIFNAGIDFISSEKWLSGSIDYYYKRGKNLLHNGIWNPTTGVSILRNNTGSLKGSGVDVCLQTKPISLQHQLTFNSSLMLAYSTNKVTSPEDFSKPARQYTETFNPVTGYPVDALFAYSFAGFNQSNGAPMGYLKGLPSEEYSKILSTRGDSVLQYVGSAVPVTVASMVHAWHLRSFTFSLQLTGRFGYYMRVQPADQLSIFDLDRQTFYQNSTANIVRADNVRLQQLQLGYELNGKPHSLLPVSRLGVVLSVNNLGFLYRANTRRIDPDVPLDGYPAGRNFTLTIHVTY